MKLYLVQHAKARPTEEDPDRSLSDQGKGEIKKVARFVRENARIQLGMIFHSGKLRARQTAEALAEQLDPTAGIELAEDLKPLSDPSVWAARLAELNEDIMLVGHLPHMSKLASLLLAEDQEKQTVRFQMGGVVCLGRNDDGVWSLEWMVIPQILS